MHASTLSYRNLKARLFFVLCALIFLSFILSQLYHSRLQTIAVAERSLESSMMVSEHAMIASISTINVSLVDIANDIREHGELLRNYSQTELMLHHRALNELTAAELRIVDAEGDLVSSSDGLKKVNLSSREFFQDLKASTDDELYITEVIPGKVKAGWVLIFARKITDRSGKFRGVVIASVTPSFFARYAEMLKLGPNDLFSIVSGKPMKYAFRTPNSDQYYGRPFINNPIAAPVFRRERQSAIYDFKAVSDDIRRWIGVTWVGKYPIVVVIGKHRGDIFKAWVMECVLYLIVATLVVVFGYFTLERILRNSLQISNHQAQLAASAKLVALGEMAASVAHEINNPLAIIKGKTEMLREKISELSLEADSAKAIVRDVDRIELTVDRISKIVSGLRNFSRNAEKDPFVERDARIIIEETIELCKERFKANHTLIRIEPMPEALVASRSAQISQVLLNLLNNSFDAVENLEERWVEIKLSALESEVQISITDSGKGIAKDVVDRMIEPFFSTKPVGKGTGLGLSISMGIIDMHGGSLRYDATSANTRFVIRLPRVKAGASPAENAA